MSPCSIMNLPKFLINETIYLLCQALNFIRTYLYMSSCRNKSEFNRETYKYIFTKMYLKWLYIAQTEKAQFIFALMPRVI